MFRHRERLKGARRSRTSGLDCFVATAPRNDGPYQPVILSEAKNLALDFKGKIPPAFLHLRSGQVLYKEEPGMRPEAVGGYSIRHRERLKGARRSRICGLDCFVATAPRNDG